MLGPLIGVSLEKMHKILISLSLLAILVYLFLIAPNYLTYNDKPPRSNVIVVLAGTDLETKIKEALRLINSGHAAIMIVPSRNQFLHLNGSEMLSLEKVGNIGQQKSTMHTDNSNHFINDNHLWGYERTHLELLTAKRMIEKEGVSSAIFISHPYHMRRIKIIAAKVFDGTDCRLHFVPTSHKVFNKNNWWLRKADLEWVVGEYIKIAWFLLYTHILNFSPA